MSQYSTFRLGDRLFGLDLMMIREINRILDITPVPHAREHIRGLINLRGQIVTAIDLRRRLGLPARTAVHPLMNVVVRSSGGSISLLVDDIGDVVETEESTFERPPDTLDGDARKMIRGVHKLNDRLMHVLDTEEVLTGFFEVAS